MTDEGPEDNEVVGRAPRSWRGFVSVRHRRGLIEADKRLCPRISAAKVPGAHLTFLIRVALTPESRVGAAGAEHELLGFSVAPSTWLPDPVCEL
jgi:hypothetical protein